MDLSGNWTDEDVLKWVENAEELVDKCSGICRDLTDGKYDLVQLVERLGPLLTHKESENRRKAVQFLTEVLGQLPNEFLQENQLKFILTFYNDRLKDHHSLIPHILTGINTLSHMRHVAEEDVLRVLFTILSGTVIMCQGQQREDRSRIFDLIILCSIKYFDTLITRKNDYIQGVINAIESERDPRNLLKLFEFMPSFLEKYPLDHWADEMFEIFACYYPIDFYPSPNDPNAITRDLLSEKLDHCLLGCRDFIEPALVLALEKLETQLKVAKMDSLVMIRNCALKFGCKEIEEKFDSIWMTMKQEMLPGSNDDVIKAALETIGVIVQESRDAQVRENILTVAFNSIAISLCDINLRLFYPAVKVANALGNASPEAAVFIGDKVAPIFLRQLSDCEAENDEKKKILWTLLKDLISVAKEKFSLKALNQEILAEVEKVFVDCLAEADESKRIIGYLGLVEMCQQTKSQTRKVIYTSLLDTLQRGVSSQIPVNFCVTRMVEHFPEEVMNEFVTPIMTNRDVVTPKNCNEIFRTLCTILGPCKMDNGEVYKYLLDNIFLFPDTTLNLNDEVEGDEHSRILLVLLKSLNELLEDSTNIHVAINLYENHHLVDRLMESRSKFKGDFILNPISRLLMNIISAQSCEEQNKNIEKYLPQLKSSLGNDLYFIYGLLCRCSNKVLLDGKYEALVLDLIQLSLVEGNMDKAQVCDHLLCFLFNRNYQNGESFERVLEESVGIIGQSMAQNGQGIRTMAWITKGLLTKGHSRADELVLKIMTCLQDANLASIAADAFECLAKDAPIRLPNLRMFHKQKLFDLVCKSLIKEDTKLDSVQLKALSRVLGELSPVVLRMHLTKVGTILFHCLEHSDPQTVQSTLQIFVRLIETDEKFCQNRVQFLIPQFTRLAQFKGTMHIRILALNCLLGISNYPTYLLIPFKQDVIFNTVSALDDHKRLVRAAAVETRTRWFLLDSPIKEK